MTDGRTVMEVGTKSPGGDEIAALWNYLDRRLNGIPHAFESPVQRFLANLGAGLGGRVVEVRGTT